MSDRVLGTWDVQLNTELAVATWKPNNDKVLKSTLEFPINEARELGAQLVEAERNSRGWEQLTIVAGDLQHGDIIESLCITVDYIHFFGIKNSDVWVWADGACVVTFRDRDMKIKVLRRIA